MAKSKTIQGCVLCGASLSLQSNLVRCSDPKCGKLHHQGTAFEVRGTRIPQPKYPEYERIQPAPVDEEMK